MVLKKVGAELEWTELADRQPGPGEIRVKMSACGVCRTDLHVVDGELSNSPRPQALIRRHHDPLSRCPHRWLFDVPHILTLPVENDHW